MTFGKKFLLGEIAHVTSGYSFKSEEFMDSGVPVIKINNIRDGFIDISDAQCVDEKFLELEERHHIKDGDVLISLTGSHITQPGSVVGRIARYTNQQIALLNQRAGKFSILDENNCDKQFLFYLLSTSNYRRSFALLAHGAASQANISPRDVEKIEIELPPLPVQRHIADILSSYDDLIENNTRRIRILEQMAQAIYQEWFGAVDEKSLPKNWQLVKVGDIADLHRGRSYGSDNLVEDGGLPFLNLKCLARDGGFRPDGLKWYKGIFKENQTATAGEIIMGLTDMTQERRIVARAARVPKMGIDLFVMSMDLLKISPKSNIHNQ